MRSHVTGMLACVRLLALIIALLPLAIAAVLALAPGAAPGQDGSAAPPPWQSASGRDHPLVGRIWDVAAATFIDAPALAARLGAARFVLLGERTNPDHHRLQAWAVRALASAGRRPIVGFEMLTDDQAPALARHLADRPRDAAGLGDAVGWKRSGWPEWATYQPIAEAAVAADLRIIAANLSSSALQGLRRDGNASLDAAFVARHGLDRPFPEDVATGMTAEIRDSHCGHAPASAIPKMIAIQRARDAHMTERLVEAAGDGTATSRGRPGDAAGSPSDGAVLIAGFGHVRTDWGVPVYLRARVPGATIASVAFLEVQTGRTTPAAHAEALGTGATLPFDYVWFTPRVDDDDPCEKARKAFEHMRDRR